ncbi:MAG: hypothetical protein WCA78_10415 [Rhizomicrobium sp.]|jgi:hypothetical protein
MHPFFFIGAVHHVIVVAVIAFFVLFAASKANGFVKILGNVLGYLLLIAAVLCFLAAATAPFFGGRPFGMNAMGYMHPGMEQGWDHHMQGPPPAQPAPPAGK